MDLETRLLFYDNPLTLVFTAEVMEILPLDSGQAGAVLRETYFYPTGGGQEHDSGSIGAAQVLDVFKDEARGVVVHTLDRPITPGAHPARIEWARRLSNMQHHSGQHLLSHSFLEALGLPSISANINWDTPSTVDLAADEISMADLLRVEEYANGVIFENRAVKTYFITDADVPHIPFRRPPKVSGSIRVVEIDGLDYTPCGGTHVLQTGTIGLVKIVRAERQNHKLRIHFVAGMQALRLFQQEHATVQAAAGLLDTRPDDVAPAIARQSERMRQTFYELEGLRAEKLAGEGRQLAEAAMPVGGVRLAAALFHARPPAELRLLAAELRKAADLVGVLGSHDGQKLSLVVCCGEGVAALTWVSARDLLVKLLAEIGGRGGGDAQMAQGGGAASEEQSASMIEKASNILRSTFNV